MTPFVLNRIAETPTTTRGILLCGSDQICEVLERGLKNKDGHFRIPAGTYPLGFHGHSKFDQPPYSYPVKLANIGYKAGHMIEICKVPNRTAILWHPGNRWRDSEGCCLTGKSVILDDDTGDYIIPAGESLPAFEEAWAILERAVTSGGVYVQINDVPLPDAKFLNPQ